MGYLFKSNRNQGKKRGIMIARAEAIKRLIEIAEAGTPGEFTTVMAELIGINFDQFLKFAQADFDVQLRVIRGLAEHFTMKQKTEDLGHCSQ